MWCCRWLVVLSVAAFAWLAGLSPAMAQQFEFARKAHLPRDESSTHAVALGDVDGDGDADLVRANWHAPKLVFDPAHVDGARFTNHTRDAIVR